MKKYIALMLSIILMLTMLASCGGGGDEGGSQGGEVQVGIVLPSRTETRWLQDEV
ncbi:MAG: hypothetical protein IJH57_04640 [Mogibacterium sp.]|nr:hypothetical protein [Mogibacterium sp.]